MKNTNPIGLVILDGFGHSEQTKYNAIAQAHKPNYDYLIKHYPNTLLEASGKHVGLLPGYIGNSEVGHMTIGAGEIIDQPVTIINNAIDNKSFYENKTLLSNFEKLKENNGRLQILGLLSSAGVHSHEKHLYAFLETALQQNIQQIYLHLFLDGRDVAPKSAIENLSKLNNFISKHKQIKIGSIQGRYYAMDRDNNWDRIEQTYKALTEKQNIKFSNALEAINFYYSNSITDEFIPPIQLDNEAVIKNNDGIIFTNFRPDRAIELCSCFVQRSSVPFQTKEIKLSFVITPVNLNHLNTIHLYESKKVENTLLDEISKKDISIFSIAETEKYAHISYFIRGKKEKLYPNETQILIPSIKSKNYIAYPCMSANEITESVVESLNNNQKDFYLINYANADMVGHSGDFDATVKAIECLDKQIGILYKEIVEKRNGALFITADHGNAEVKFDETTNQPSTSHTTNKVPFIFINQNVKDKGLQLHLSQLSDIKKFILDFLHN